MLFLLFKPGIFHELIISPEATGKSQKLKHRKIDLEVLQIKAS